MALTPSEQKAIRLKKLKEDYKKAKEKNEKTGLFGSRVRSLKSKIEKLGGTVAAPKPSKPKKPVSKEEKEKRANKSSVAGLTTKGKTPKKAEAPKKEKKPKVKTVDTKPKKKEPKGGKATVSPNQKSRQTNLPKTSKVTKKPDQDIGGDTSVFGADSKLRFRPERLEGLRQTTGKSTLGPSAGSKKKTKTTGGPGPAELASDDPVRKEKERSRRERGRDVITKSAGSKKDKDSFGAMLARAMGDKRSKAQMVRDREMNEKDEEEMGRNKGGAIKKTYGMRSGGFTKRGGMYKKGY